MFSPFSPRLLHMNDETRNQNASKVSQKTLSLFLWPSASPSSVDFSPILLLAPCFARVENCWSRLPKVCLFPYLHVLNYWSRFPKLSKGRIFAHDVLPNQPSATNTDRLRGPIMGRGTYLGHRHVQDKRKVIYSWVIDY